LIVVEEQCRASQQLRAKYHVQANILTIHGRQQLERLTRDEKIINRALAQLTEKRQSPEEQITTHNESLNTQMGKRVEAMHYPQPLLHELLSRLISVYSYK
jgi:hypothetical protein